MDNTIYYVCKYTPKEIFSGFDQPTERLDPAPILSVRRAVRIRIFVGTERL